MFNYLFSALAQLTNVGGALPAKIFAVVGVLIGIVVSLIFIRRRFH